MKTIIKTAVVFLGLNALFLVGCEQPHKKPLSAEAEACRGRITSFRMNVGLDDVKILRDGRNIAEQTLSLTNGYERAALFHEFVDEFYKIDIGKCTSREAKCMLGRYCLMPEYLAYGLLRAGGGTEEAWRVLVTGLEKYRQLCFSFGDENDLSDGWLPEARDRRHSARLGRKSWNGCLLFCSDHSIKSVFGVDSKDTISQFQRRLQDKFKSDFEKMSFVGDVSK